MADRRPIFDLLLQERDPSADRALLAALDGADHDTAIAIIDTLLERGRRVGLSGLVAAFHRLEPALGDHILAEPERLFAGLRETMHSRDEQVRVDLMRVIERGRLYRAAYLLDTGLRDRSSSVRSAAATALHALAGSILAVPELPSLNELPVFDPASQQVMVSLETRAEDRRQVVAALEEGVNAYGTHLQALVIEAAAWLCDDLGQRFWAVVSVPGSKAGRAASHLLGSLRDPRLVPFAIGALQYSELRPLVTRALAGGVDPAFLEVWMRQGWRLVQAKTRRAAATIREMNCLDSGAESLLKLSDLAQQRAVHWLTATGLDRQLVLQVLRDLHRRGSRETQRAVVWGLTRIEGDEVIPLLRAMGSDRDPEWSRIARTELALRAPGTWRPADLLGLYGDGSSAVDPAADATPFDRYWRRFDGLDDESRVRQGRQLLDDANSFERAMTDMLANGDSGERVRALRIIGLLAAGERFRGTLVQLAHDPNPDVRSAAVKAMAPLEDGSTRRVLSKALNDENPRVQANAVEALDRPGSRVPVEDLLPKLASVDNRVRANAVKVLLQLQVRDAAETLLRMLQDESRAHRISALWLVERLGIFALAGRISAMSRQDQDVQVRTRAGLLMDQLAGASEGASVQVGGAG